MYACQKEIYKSDKLVTHQNKDRRDAGILLQNELRVEST